MESSEKTSLSIQQAHDRAKVLKDKIAEVIFGQEDLILETMCCFLAGGHILMTGAPGLAKTTLVRVFAKNVGLNFGRVQFTPDLLPADILGSDILNVDPASGKRGFEFSKGPVFVNLLLADEINRSSPRTQSALLEAMQERSVTVGGKRYGLPLPFMVFATQNPFESEGTFPLPEAQLDRFLIHSLVDYPDPAAEEKMLKAHSENRLVGEQKDESHLANAAGALSAQEVAEMIDASHRVSVDDELLAVVGNLVRLTRPENPDCPESYRDLIWYGAGPRAGLSLISTARALALIEGEDRVRWKQIKRMAAPVLRHRIRLSAAAGRSNKSVDDLIKELLQRVESVNANIAKGVA